MREEGRASDLQALRHPLFWAALALLLLNDHWLKGAGVLPGWLTGKLSDFAGLLVAPVLLSALFVARSRRTRAMAFTLVCGWFTAANLFAPVAAATGALGAWLGLSWSFWVDPTDLVALAIVPVAWQVAAHRGARLGVRLGQSAEKLALGLGIAACVASPGPGAPFYQTAAYLVNDTDQTIQLRVRRLDVQVDCAAIRERFTDTLSRDAFGAGTVYNIGPSETFPLDLRFAGGEVEADTFGGPPPVETGHVGTCDLVMISATGLPEQIVYWEGLTERTIPARVTSAGDRGATADGLHVLPVEDDLEALTLLSTGSYSFGPPVEIYDGGACHDYGAITGFDWSDLPSWENETVRFVDVRPTIDGCVQVEIEAAETYIAYICVPPGDFPFLTNSVVRISNGPRQLRIIRDLPLDDGTLWRTGELVIARGVSGLDEGPFSVDLTVVDADCRGVRMECGGFRVPAAGGLQGADGGVRFVHPGDVIELDAADGRRARLRVGRAERMWVTGPACGAGRDQLGPRLEALVVYGEEPR